MGWLRKLLCALFNVGCEPSPPPDPCDNVICPEHWHCEDGNCVQDDPTSCQGVVCGPGYHCEEGVCVKDEEPPPPPEWMPPTAAELAQAGHRVEIRPQREGGKNVGYTPWAEFGRDYYCREEVDWPEACAEGRSRGPVAPEGHPKRVEWEKHFLGQPCATFSYESNEHMSFDPYYVIDGVNQNHPRNVRVCGQTKFGGDPSWVKEEHGGHFYISRGQWSIASAHGNGEVCAEAKGGVGRKCMKYEE